MKLNSEKQKKKLTSKYTKEELEIRKLILEIIKLLIDTILDIFK